MSRFSRFLHIPLILLSLWSLSRCATPVSRAELDTAQQQIEAGQEQALVNLFDRRQDVPEAEKEHYIEAIASAKSDLSSVMLQELYNEPGYEARRPAILKQLIEQPGESDARFVQKSVTESPDLFSAELEQALLRRADRASAETLYAMIEAGQTELKPASIRLFGEAGLEDSLPLLIEHADAGKDIEVTMQAIARLGTNEAGQYILTTAQNAEHPARMAAIRRLSAVKDQDQARSLLHSLTIETHPETRIAALEALSGMGFHEESYDLAKGLYEDDDKDVRLAALYAMAAMRQVDPEALKEELETLNTANRQEEKESVTIQEEAKPVLPRKRPATQKKVARQKKTGPAKTVRPTKKGLYRIDESAAGSRRHTGRLDRSFQRLFGREAGDVRLKIHNALLTYADSSSNNARFIQRSYQKGFGVDEARAKELLKKGLHLPNGLDAILANIRREYRREDLQIYALSTFFAIKRRQAAALLEAHRKRTL